MAFITREDGERFIVPTYRDVLAKSSALKQEIQELASRYGEYTYIHQRNPQQYEVAYSPDPGYLFGETIWYYFKRPRDLLYCEQLPNTEEAILVVVTDGNVFLEGTFPIDSLTDELIVFTTQKNNFEVYLHGDLPISQIAEPGKFALPESSIKKFTVLDKSAFNTMPTVKTLQLQLVDTSLKAQNIGVFPYKLVLTVIIGIAAIWFIINLMSGEKKEEAPVAIAPPPEDPYAGYYRSLVSPNPQTVIDNITHAITMSTTLPGWSPNAFIFDNKQVRVKMQSQGTNISLLATWAEQNGVGLEVMPTGLYLVYAPDFSNRPKDSTIYLLDQVTITLADRLSYVLPANVLQFKLPLNKGQYKQTSYTINFSAVTPSTFNLIGRMIVDLPIVINKVTGTIDETGSMSGIINLDALGK